MSLVQSNNFYTQTLKFQNGRNQAIMLRLEPWGEEVSIASGDSFQVTATGPEPPLSSGGLEVEDGADYIVVYGWPGSTISATCEDVPIAGSAVSVPKTPSLWVPGRAAQTGISLKQVKDLVQKLIKEQSKAAIRRHSRAGKEPKGAMKTRLKAGAPKSAKAAALKK
jgi:hypothetical protein